MKYVLVWLFCGVIGLTLISKFDDRPVYFFGSLTLISMGPFSIVVSGLVYYVNNPICVSNCEKDIK